MIQSPGVATHMSIEKSIFLDGKHKDSLSSVD
jgi:hypothetical protein